MEHLSHGWGLIVIIVCVGHVNILHFVLLQSPFWSVLRVVWFGIWECLLNSSSRTIIEIAKIVLKGRVMLLCLSGTWEFHLCSLCCMHRRRYERSSIKCTVAIICVLVWIFDSLGWHPSSADISGGNLSIYVFNWYAKGIPVTLNPAACVAAIVCRSRGVICVNIGTAWGGTQVVDAFV